MNDAPVVIIFIIVGLIAIALLAYLVSRSQKENIFKNLFLKKKAFAVQWLIGLVLALVGAFFMFDGDILGADTAGIARIIGIVGIGLIATSGISIIGSGRKSTGQ